MLLTGFLLFSLFFSDFCIVWFPYNSHFLPLVISLVIFIEPQIMFPLKFYIVNCPFHINAVLTFWSIFLCFFINWLFCLIFMLGGCKCTCRSNSIYHECIAGLSYILAHLQHHGSKSVCWQILSLCQYHNWWDVWCQWCQQLYSVWGTHKKQSKCPMEKCESKLW